MLGTLFTVGFFLFIIYLFGKVSGLWKFLGKQLNKVR